MTFSTCLVCVSVCDVIRMWLMCVVLRSWRQVCYNMLSAACISYMQLNVSSDMSIKYIMVIIVS